MADPITTTNTVATTFSSPAVGVTASASTVGTGILYYIGAITPYLAFYSLALGSLVLTIHFALILYRLFKGNGKKLDDVGE